MKRLLQFILILAVSLGQVSCEGDEGPEGPPGPTGAQGPQGPQGPPGVTQVAQVFEIVVDFTAENNYQFGFDIADYNEVLETNIVINESDIVMAFMAVGAIDDKPLWGALPQTFNPAAGQQVTYKFANSDQVLLLYLSAAQATLSQLSEDYTTDQYFRFVVIPGELMNGRMAAPSVDLTDYEQVKAYYNINDSNVPKVKLN